MGFRYGEDQSGESGLVRRAARRERTHGRPNAQSRLEAVPRPLVVAVAVEQDAESDLHVRVDGGEFGALAPLARLGSRAGGTEEEVDDAVRGVPRTNGGRGGGSGESGVGEGEPSFEGCEGTLLLSFVDVRDGEGLGKGKGVSKFVSGGRTGMSGGKKEGAPSKLRFRRVRHTRQPSRAPGSP